MRYVAAYLLASLGGNKEPTASDIEAILETVGIDVDKERLEKVVSELSGKNINELIEAGKQKLAAVPTGGAVAASAGGAAAAGGGDAGAADAKEEKKEEKKEESEESDDDMGFGLFD